MNEFEQKLAAAGIQLVGQSAEDVMKGNSELKTGESLQVIHGNAEDTEVWSESRNGGCPQPSNR